jgi:hypothetical protein
MLIFVSEFFVSFRLDLTGVKTTSYTARTLDCADVTSDPILG